MLHPDLNIVVRHDEDGSLWATVEELPGVFATGDTMDELRESLQEGISLYLASPDQPTPHVTVGELRPKHEVASASVVYA